MAQNQLGKLNKFSGQNISKKCNNCLGFKGVKIWQRTTCTAQISAPHKIGVNVFRSMRRKAPLIQTSRLNNQREQPLTKRIQSSSTKTPKQQAVGKNCTASGKN
jgi:hypothetical protein